MATSKRRYPIKPKYKAYSETFDAARVGSDVLNSASHNPSVYSPNLSDRRSLAYLIGQLRGYDDDGRYYDSGAGEWKLAAIPSLRQALKEVEEKWEEQKQQVKQTGRVVPTEMSSDLWEKKLALEGYIDVREEEAEAVEVMIAKIDAVVEEKRVKRMLKHGPVGSATLRGGAIVELDGQKVTPLDDGQFVINDSNSPYNGMSTQDYFTHIQRPFSEARNELRKRMRKEFREGRREKFHPNAKPPLPKWSKGVHNYLKEPIKEQSDESGK